MPLKEELTERACIVDEAVNELESARVVGLEGLERGMALVSPVVVPLAVEAARSATVVNGRRGHLVARGGGRGGADAAVVLLVDLAALLAAVTVLGDLRLWLMLLLLLVF